MNCDVALSTFLRCDWDASATAAARAELGRWEEPELLPPLLLLFKRAPTIAAIDSPRCSSAALVDVKVLMRPCLLPAATGKAAMLADLRIIEGCLVPAWSRVLRP